MRPTVVINVLLLTLISTLYSCDEKLFYEEKTFAGEKIVQPEVLNLGHRTYTTYCIQCHGVNGDGKGPSSKGLYPPPRNFTKGIFKFASVPAGELPLDEDFMHTIRKGLHGTAMLPWDMGDERLSAVIQYIKTFAPQVWEVKNKKVGTKIVLRPDPFSAQKDAAILRGKEVYHIVANCQTCHRSYLSDSEFSALNQKINGEPIKDFEETRHQVKPQDSEYGVRMVPPDFTWHEVRSAQTVDELAMRIAAGIGGVGMPTWKDVIEDEDIWAVAYYVRSLMDMRNTNERYDFINKVDAK